MHGTNLILGDRLLVGGDSDLKGELDVAGAATLSDVAKIVFSNQSVAAAGSSQGDATAISLASGRLIFVTDSNAAKGVKLPALTTMAVGELVIIINTVAATLKVYPNTDDKIGPLADNAAATVLADSALVLVKHDATEFVGFMSTTLA